MKPQIGMIVMVRLEEWMSHKTIKRDEYAQPPIVETVEQVLVPGF